MATLAELEDKAEEEQEFSANLSNKRQFSEGAKDMTQWKIDSSMYDPGFYSLP